MSNYKTKIAKNLYLYNCWYRMPELIPLTKRYIDRMYICGRCVGNISIIHLSGHTYIPDFRPRDMAFPFCFSAHPLPLFAY